MKTIKTFLPVFPGFYNTIFDSDSEDSEIEYWKQETGRDITYDDIEWDYSSYTENVAKQCVEILEQEINCLGYSLQFIYESLVSPKYYNYYNDSINITIKSDVADLKKLYCELIDNKDDFEDYIKEKYTSRPGFISHYSNNVADWLGEYWSEIEDNGHILGSILEFICSLHGIDQLTLHNQCVDKYITGTLKER